MQRGKFAKVFSIYIHFMQHMRGLQHIQMCIIRFKLIILYNFILFFLPFLIFFIPILCYWQLGHILHIFSEFNQLYIQQWVMEIWFFFHLNLTFQMGLQIFDYLLLTSNPELFGIFQHSCRGLFYGWPDNILDTQAASLGKVI